MKRGNDLHLSDVYENFDIGQKKVNHGNVDLDAPQVEDKVDEKLLERSKIMYKVEELELRLDLKTLMDYLRCNEDEVALEIGLMAFFSRIMKDSKVNKSNSRNAVGKIIPDITPGENVVDNVENNRDNEILDSIFDKSEKCFLLKEYLESSPECVELVDIIEQSLKAHYYSKKNYTLIAVLKVASVVIRFNDWSELSYSRMNFGPVDLTDCVFTLFGQIIMLGSQYAKDLFQNIQFYHTTISKMMSRKSEVHYTLHVMLLKALKLRNESLIEDVLKSKVFGKALIKDIHTEKLGLTRKVLSVFYFDVITNHRVSKLIKIEYFSKSLLRDLSKLAHKQYQHANSAKWVVDLSNMSIRFLKILLTNSIYGIVVPNSLKKWLPGLSMLPAVSSFPMSKNNEKFLDSEDIARSNKSFLSVLYNLDPIKSEFQENLILSILSQDVSLARQYFDSFTMDLTADLNSVWMSKMEWVINLIGQPQDVGGILTLFNTGKYSFEHIVNWIVPKAVFQSLNGSIQSNHTTLLYTSLTLFIKCFQVLEHWHNTLESHILQSSGLLNQFLEGLLQTFYQKLPDFSTVNKLFVTVVNNLNGGAKLESDIPDSSSPLAVKIKVSVSEVYQSILSVLKFYLTYFPDVFIATRFDFSRLFGTKFSLLTPESVDCVISIVNIAFFKLNWSSVIFNNNNETQLKMFMKLATQAPQKLRPKALQILESVLEKSTLFSSVKYEISIWTSRLTNQPAVLSYLENALKLVSSNSKIVTIVEDVISKRIDKYSKKWNFSSRHMSTNTTHSEHSDTAFKLPFSHLVPSILCYHEELCAESKKSDRTQILSYVISALLDILYAQTDPTPFLLITLKNKYLSKNKCIQNFVRYLRGLFDLSPEKLSMKVFSKNLIDANQAAHLNIQISLWDCFDLIKNLGGLKTLSFKNLTIHFLSSKFRTHPDQILKFKSMLLENLQEITSECNYTIFSIIKLLLFYLATNKSEPEVDLIFDILDEVLLKASCQSTLEYIKNVKFLLKHPFIVKHFTNDTTFISTRRVSKTLSVMFTHSDIKNAPQLASITTPYLQTLLMSLQHNHFTLDVIDNFNYIIEIFNYNQLNTILLDVLNRLAYLVNLSTQSDGDLEVMLNFMFSVANKCSKQIYKPQNLPEWVKPILYKKSLNGFVVVRTINVENLIRLVELKLMLNKKFYLQLDCLIFESLLRFILSDDDSELDCMGSNLPDLILSQVSTLSSLSAMNVYAVASAILCCEARNEELEKILNSKKYFASNKQNLNTNESCSNVLPNLILINLLLEKSEKASVYFEPFSHVVAMAVIDGVESNADNNSDLIDLELIKHYGVSILVKLLRADKIVFKKKQKQSLAKKMQPIIQSGNLMTSAQWTLFCNIESDRSIKADIFLKQITQLAESTHQLETKYLLNFDTLNREMGNIFTESVSHAIVHDALKSVLKKGFCCVKILEFCTGLLSVYKASLSVSDLSALHNLIFSHSKFMEVLMNKNSHLDSRVKLIDLMYQIYDMLTCKGTRNNLFTSKLLSIYLSIYEATLSDLDQKLLLIIHCFELNGVGISECGFFWGSNLRRNINASLEENGVVESFVFSGKLFTSEKINNTLSLFPINTTIEEWKVLRPEDVWDVGSGKTSVGKLNLIYDLRFVLPYINLLINYLNIDCYKFLQTGIHSLAFFGLACTCKLLTKISYQIVIEIFKLLEKKNHHQSLKLIMSSFKQSDLLHLSTLQASFLSRVIPILVNPTHAMFKVVSKSILHNTTSNFEFTYLWRQIMSIDSLTTVACREWLFDSITLGLSSSKTLKELPQLAVSSLLQFASSTVVSEHFSFLERKKIWILLNRILLLDNKLEHLHSILSFVAAWSNSFYNEFSAGHTELIYAVFEDSNRVYLEYRYLYDSLSHMKWESDTFWPLMYQLIFNTTLYLESQVLVENLNCSSNTAARNILQRMEHLLTCTVRALFNSPFDSFTPPSSLLMTLFNLSSNFYQYNSSSEWLLVKTVSKCQWADTSAGEAYARALEMLLSVYDQDRQEHNLVLFDLIHSIGVCFANLTQNHQQLIDLLARFYRRTKQFAIIISLNNVFALVLLKTGLTQLTVKFEQDLDTYEAVILHSYCPNEEIDLEMRKKHSKLAAQFRLALLKYK